MAKPTFVVFKKQEGELVNAYSLVDSETLTTIPQDIIHAQKEVEEKLYTTEEFEALRAELI